MKKINRGAMETIRDRLLEGWSLTQVIAKGYRASTVTTVYNKLKAEGKLPEPASVKSATEMFTGMGKLAPLIEAFFPDKVLTFELTQDQIRQLPTSSVGQIFLHIGEAKSIVTRLIPSNSPTKEGAN